MMTNSNAPSRISERVYRSATDIRWAIVRLFFVVFTLFVILRLWNLQVVNHEAYAKLSIDQTQVYQLLIPNRGEIYATEKDLNGGSRAVPLALNHESSLVYADPRKIDDPQKTAEVLAPILGEPVEKIFASISKKDDPYEPLRHRVGPDIKKAIQDLQLNGIGILPEIERFYPGNNVASHILGFVSYPERIPVGQYGLEGYFNDELTGKPGNFQSDKNSAGVWIALSDRDLTPAVDGSDLYLTIDWTIQFKACQELNAWVQKHGASGGSVIVMNPQTGAIIAMCGAPDYNPNIFNEISRIKEFNNPAIFLQYEPGSIAKPLTMAAALDQQKVTPTTTYNDTGAVVIGPKTIHNSDGKGYGIQTMTDVLAKSLNTGAIFAMRQVGVGVFRKYLEDFGLSIVSGINLMGEASGSLRSLYDSNEIYGATASYGQGILVTPLQMVAAYSAIANSGKLMKPYIVQEINHPDGSKDIFKPETIRQVISQKTSAILSGMLVNVVEEGHGKKAGVKGYYIAGKTGTAEIPRADGKGYESGANIGSFVGFGPVNNPKFAMIVRIDRPKDVQFAESSAAPLFGELAKFILQYYEVPPER